MPSEFVVDGGTSEVRVETLASDLSAVTGPVHTETRTWWDTFDWALYDAGLLLEHRIRGDQAWLVLSGLDGQQIARLPFRPRIRPPLAPEKLPAGAIADRVADLAGIRSLLPRASATGPVTVLSVTDKRDKTVARVAVEGPAAIEPGEAELGRRLRVEPLRGYEKEARRVGRRLAELPGLTTAGESLFEAVCEAAGVRPGEYRSKPVPLRDSAEPAAEAFAGLLGQLLEIMRSNLDGTLRRYDTEFLHDLRVAVRRSRSLLKLDRGVLPAEVREHLGAELKWLGDETSASRDLDVYLLGFDAMTAEVPDAHELDPFRALLEAHCRAAHTTLNRALRSARFRRLTEYWGGDLVVAGELGPDGMRPAGKVADARLARAWRRVEQRGNAITAGSPAEDLHNLRKRCKELRYLLEFFAGLYDAKAHKTIVTELKQLQDNLGEFQDAESQRHLVRDHAEELGEHGAPAGTLLALGRLEEHLEHRQHTARHEFAARWKRFDRPRNRWLFEGLVSG